MKTLVPIESSPQVFASLLHSWGVGNVCVNDVYSLDPEMLALLPRPVYAYILAFPVSSEYEKYRQRVDSAPARTPSHAVWYKQLINNSCGSMAVAHTVANGLPANCIAPDSFAHTLVRETSCPTTTDDERAKYIETSSLFESLHSRVAHCGSTASPSAQDESNTHYVCITRHVDSGHILELDGRRAGPLDWGAPLDSSDCMCEIAHTAINRYLSRNDGYFSILAICAPSS